MPDQPERPIEKLLRECAKGRVPSEGFELHPANRRLLQDEVARTYPGKKGRSNWFGPHFMPRLAWGFCAFSVVGLAVIMSVRSERQNKSDSLVARKEIALAPAAPANVPIPLIKTESAPGVQPNISLSDNLLTAANEPAPSTALSLQSTPAPQTDAASMVARNLAEQQLATEAAARTEFAAAAPASALEPRAPAGRTLRDGLASTAAPLPKQTSETATVLNFAREQTTAQVDEEKRAQPILTSFKLERMGSEIQITDQDGSVYSGTLGPLQTQVPVTAARRDQGALSNSGGVMIVARKASLAPSAQVYSFHVTGTNRTLRELISFQGQWSTFTNVPPLAQVEKDANRGVALDKQTSGPAPARSNPIRIWGTVSIQGSDSININAVSVPP